MLTPRQSLFAIVIAEFPAVPGSFLQFPAVSCSSRAIPIMLPPVSINQGRLESALTELGSAGTVLRLWVTKVWSRNRFSKQVYSIFVKTKNILF